METIRTDGQRLSRKVKRSCSCAAAPVEDHNLLPMRSLSYAVAPVEDDKLLPISTKLGSCFDSFGATAVEDQELLLRMTSFYLNGRLAGAHSLARNITSDNRYYV
jgi:hypothetical protein